MNRPLLELLADYLIRTAQKAPEETWIVLPNKRAGVFLQRHLADYTREVCWSPRILTIGELVEDLSLLTEKEPVELIFLLYDIYAGLVDEPESPDDFFHWGQVMLNDFDEIDKYLVDADMLFRNIVDLKELEEPLAGLTEEQTGFIRRFWAGFLEGDRTVEKERFLATWRLLPILYHKLSGKLRSAGEGYQGMQYRDIARRIADSRIEPPECDRLVIAGFNALNGCEKRIFSWLQHHGAEFFWDYDRSYTGRPSLEAGRFLRENLLKYPSAAELEDFNGLESDKDIRIFELPSDLLQAKMAGRLLEDTPGNRRDVCTDTALVLCDEALLMPVVMSLPADLADANVTMGYPLKHTSVSDFTELLIRMQSNIREGPGGVTQIYYRDVLSLLLHPYLRRDGAGDVHSAVGLIRNANQIYVDRAEIRGSFEQKLFSKVRTAQELIPYLREIFREILEMLSTGDAVRRKDLERELVFQLLIQLNKLQLLVATRSDLTFEMVARLIRRYLSALSVPFEGEPLKGIQIMGILETRMLDFRHVILLSMQEEVMPGTTTRQSYIPYSLRIGYRMPSREDMDGIYAYYFNRLLQRAERIDLLYNGTSEGVKTGEMSRYLYQLVFDRGAGIIRPGLEIVSRITPPITIPHTGIVQEKLQRYLYQGESGNYLSPSAINTYLTCPLKFYFRFIAGISEPDEVQEEIDPAGFGTVVHEAVSRLYREAAESSNGVITRAELERFERSGTVQKVLEKTFIKHHFSGRRHAVIEGRNIIIMSVMERYLEKIIGYDKKHVPFTLLSAEDVYERNLDVAVQGRLIRVRLGGKIDRVDLAGDGCEDANSPGGQITPGDRSERRVRVIDYKTGIAGQGFSFLEDLFNPDFTSRNSAAFQALFYAWLVMERFPKERIVPGLYVLRTLHETDYEPSLTVGKGKGKERIRSFLPMAESFEEKLRQTVSRVFDPGVPFSQTGHQSRCAYCDFAAVCNREPDR